MMTAMARLPCKQQTVPSSEHHQPRHSNNNSSSSSNCNNNNNSSSSNGNHLNEARVGYWGMQPTSRQPTSVPPSYVRNPSRQHIDNTGKRKSAVELLQESKAFYVKSEIVLDRKQELKNSGHLQVAPSTAAGAPPRLLRKCGNPIACGIQQQQQQSLQLIGGLNQLPNATAAPSSCCWANCRDPDRPDGILSPQRTLPPALPPKSPRLIPVPQRRAISGPPTGANGGDQLQTKLRRLLNTDSKENVFFPDITTGGNALPSGNLTIVRGDHSFEKFRYSAASPSTVCRDEERALRCNVPTDVRFKIGRSNSHSHTSAKANRKSTTSPPTENSTVVCHKSLPDLHTSARRRASLSPRASTKSSSKPTITHTTVNNCPDCETSSDYSDHSFKRDNVCYRSSRHIRRSMGSGGGDASSVLSSGGRTQKSSGSSKLSHGATARDSGGSSGHCTHRSEPPPRIQDCWSHIRRDSGASTQHSTEKDRSRKGSYGSGTSASVVRNLSPDTESSNSQTDYSPTCNTRYSDGWKEGGGGRSGRPILRSKSDISDRYWRHENGRGKKISSRSARSVTQLENFFDRLGLDPDHYHLITEPNSKTSSPVFFESVSSVDSALGLYPWTGNNGQTANGGQQWQTANNCSTGMGNDEANSRVSDPPSIVERNARIIKWLCQCRKIQFGYS